MPRQRKEKTAKGKKPESSQGHIFSIVNEISKELNKPYFSVQGARFLFEKNGCSHAITVEENYIIIEGWVGGALLHLQKDKLSSFCGVLKELPVPPQPPLTVEILLDSTTKDVFAVFPRVRFPCDKTIGSAVSFVRHSQNLLAKVKGIVDEFRVYDKSSEALEKLWEGTRSVTNKMEKGKLLEELLCLLIGQDENFAIAERNFRTKSEEIDIVVENLGRTVFYSQLRSPIILVECKNWTSKIGAKEIRNFAQKIQNRPKVLCSIGILVATSKLTRDAKEELIGYRGKDFLISVLDRTDIETIIKKKLRMGEFLKSKFRKAGLR